ncbi:MAG: hypothetical protein ACI9XO_004034 [Paraglaciecola sp.]|jgi:hypothetical protein
MSKFQEAVELYKNEMTKMGMECDEALLTKVTKGCGPSIYNLDASKVSGSDQAELDRVKNNFLIKKLGMTDSSDLDDAINATVEKMGKSNRNKYRAIFYYLLVKHFKKEAHYA